MATDPAAAPTPARADGHGNGRTSHSRADPLDGEYDGDRWRPTSDSTGDFVQEGGLLVVLQDTEPESATRLVARAYDFERLESPTAFEADLMLSPDEGAGTIHLAREGSRIRLG